MHMDRELAQLIEGILAQELRDYVDAWERADSGGSAEAEPCGGGWMVYTGADSPVTQAVGLGMAGPVASDDLDRLEEFFESRGAVPRVSLCPFADSSLPAALGARGFELEEFENVMVRRLERAVPAVSVTPRAGGVSVRGVSGADAGHWRDVIGRGMRSLGPSEALSALDIALCDAFRVLRDTTCYLAWEGDRPLGGDCLAIHGDVASLFASATLPEARGRGVQGALLADHVQTAASLGCRLMMAGAAPGGVSQRNMERLGFRVAYTDVMLRRVSRQRGEGRRRAGDR